MNNTINSDLIRGNIDTIILRALYSGDRYGYDIVKEIEQRSSGQYKLKQPTLYSCLKRLETQGFIKSYWGAKSIGGRRKYYTLTDMGKELFIRNKTDWEYSRSLIDNLITDKDPILDMDEEDTALQQNMSQNSDQAVADSNESYVFSEDEDETLSGDYLTEDAETDHTVFSGTTESIPETTDNMQLQNHETEVGPDEIVEITEPVHYRNASELINNLFLNEEDGVNYTTKLAGEKYQAQDLYTDAHLRTDSYFKDIDYQEALEEEEPQETVAAFTETAQPVLQERFEAYHERLPENNLERSSHAGNASEQFYSYKSDPSTIQRHIIEEPNREEILKKFESKLSSRQAEQESDYPPSVLKAEFPAGASQPKETDFEGAEIFHKEQIQIRNFKKLSDSVNDLGEGVKIRKYESDTSKEYNVKYYYFPNKLKLKQYAILFGIMLLQIVLCYLIVEVGLRGSMTVSNTDLAFYMVGVIAALTFPVIAFFLNWFNPNKRKRINYSFRNSMLFNIVIMVQLAVIIYFVNVLAGMPLLSGPKFYTTLILPMILCINFPINAIIFHFLFRSEEYAVK